MHHLSLIVLLLIGYLVITASIAPGNIVAGLVMAVVITLLLRPRWTPVRPRRIPKMLWAALHYLVVVSLEILQNGLFVAAVVLRPSVRPRSAVVAVQSGLRDETGLAISAHGITVSPGELVVEIGQGGVLYVHCLDLHVPPEKIVAATQRREALLRQIVE